MNVMDSGMKCHGLRTGMKCHGLRTEIKCHGLRTGMKLSWYDKNWNEMSGNGNGVSHQCLVRVLLEGFYVRADVLSIIRAHVIVRLPATKLLPREKKENKVIHHTHPQQRI